jgi:outer membrane protein assembly factor BamB
VARGRLCVGLVAILVATFVGAAVRDPRVIGQGAGGGPIGWWRGVIGDVGGAAPVVADGVAYTTSPDGTVTAFDALTGTQHWRTAGAESIVASPTVAGDSVVVAGSAGTIRSLDAATGVELWQAPLGQHVEAPVAVTAGSIYVGTGTSLVALDASSGSVSWTLDLGGSVLTAPVVVDGRIVVVSGFSMCAVAGDTGALLWCQDIGTAPTSAPSITDGTAIVGGWDGSVVSVGVADGRVGWRTMTPDGAPVKVSAAHGQVLAADDDGVLAALDGATGDERWRVDVGRRAVGPPVVVGDRLLVTLADGVLDMLDASDGSAVWRYGSGVGLSPATVADGVAYAVTSGGGLVAIGDASDPRRPRTGDANPDPAVELTVAGGGPARAGRQPGPGPDGAPVVAWSHDFGADLDSSPVSGDGLVFVGDREGFLFAMDARTGVERWRFAASNWISQSAAVAGDAIFVGDDDGNLFGVSVADGRQLWRVRLGAPVSEPVVAAGETVFAVERDGPLHALDVASGTERWRLDDASSPAIADGVAYLRSGAALTAVDALTGVQRWTVDVSFEGAPSVAGGLVYVHSASGLVHVFDALTGIEQPVTISGHGGFAVGDGVVVMAARDAQLEGVDLATGWQRWTFGTLGTRAGNVPTVPVVAGDTAYVGTTDGTGRLEAVDLLSGMERWRYDAGTDILLTQPLVTDGVVFVGAGSTLLALAAPDALPLSTREPRPVPSGTSPTHAPGPSSSSPPGNRTAAMLGGGPGRTGVQPGPAPRTGPAERWRYAANGDLMGGTAVIGGVVYVVDDRGAIAAVDAATGTEVWRFDTGSAPGRPVTPVVADASVYAVDGVQLHALDAATGVERWSMALVSGGSAALVGSDLFVSGPGSLSAVNVGGARGFVRWTFNEPSLADVAVDLLDPAVSGGSVFVIEPASRLVEGSGALVALDAATGAEQWRVTDVDGERFAAAAAAADGVVYAGGADGSLWAFDAVTGDLRWAADTGAEVTSAPAVADGLVVVGNDDGDVVAVDVATGAERWRMTTDDVVVAAPSVTGDAVLVASYDGHTYALDASTGDALWDVRTGRETDGPPSIIDGSVFVTAGQDVIAYGP